MKIPTRLKSPGRWLLAGLLLLNLTAFADDEDSVLTSVFAKTNSGYKRKKDAEGRWVREYYAMTNGGPEEGSIQDNTQEKIKFASLASVLAEHLARQGYFPATDPQKVDLLIVVKWGRTTPFSDGTYRSGTDNVMAAMNTISALGPITPPPTLNSADTASGPPAAEVSITASPENAQRQAAQTKLVGAMLTQDMFNRARDQANEMNAHMLGYLGDINKSDGLNRLVGGGAHFDELLADIEEPRYYVIVTAFDFNKTVREKKSKTLWVTRMSMRAPGNSFAKKAASMVAYGASRFGQNTDGLERKEHPNYKVNLEETKFLGVAEKAPAPAPAATEKK